MLITVVNKGNEVNYAIRKVIDLIHQFDNLDDIEDQYGKGSIVTGTDKDGNEIRYFHTTAIRRIPSDFDATIYSHLGDKTEAGTSLSKERESTNIINHQFK